MNKPSPSLLSSVPVPLIAAVTMLVAIGLVNFNAFQKQQLKEQGLTVMLKLAPVDPRSIMQGDYMTLRFDVAGQIRRQLDQQGLIANYREQQVPISGLAYLELDHQQVAALVAIELDYMEPLDPKRLDRAQVRLKNQSPIAHQADSVGKLVVMEFKLRQRQIRFATDAYFFQEGTGDSYTMAEYGKFSVNERGEALLLSLHDKDLVMLTANTAATRE